MQKVATHPKIKLPLERAPQEILKIWKQAQGIWKKKKVDPVQYLKKIRQEIDAILRTVSLIPIDSQIARLSGFFKRKYEIGLPDAIVAATSYLTNSILVSRNIKDFKEIQEIRKKFV